MVIVQGISFEPDMRFDTLPPIQWETAPPELSCEELAEAVGNLIAGASTVEYQFNDGEIDQLVKV